MEIAQKRIKAASESTLYKLYPLGDLHLGSPACDYARAKKVVDLIKNDPHAMWIGMGDYADCILPGDPRWTMRVLDWSKIGRDDKGHPEVSDLGQELVDLTDDFFAPIWSKCIGLLEGNHEQTFSKYYHSNLTKRLATKHYVPFLGQSCLYRLEWEGNKWGVHFDIYGEHGATGGGTEGNAVNNFMQRLGVFDADIYLKGHIHKKGAHKKSEFQWGPRRPRIKTRLMVLTGTFLQGTIHGETTYAEQKGLPPNELGSYVVLIRPRQRYIEAVEVSALELIGG